MIKLLEYLFDRWKSEIIEQGSERWTRKGEFINSFQYERDYVIYKYTHKFDGSTKIKKVYLN